MRGGHVETPASGFAHRVAVVGDFMLDAYVTGSVSRVCPDAPAPVLDAGGEVLSAGGAGNVAIGCANYGFEVVACGFTGSDREAEALETLLASSGVKLDGLVSLDGRTTLVKRRFCAGEHVLLRVDEGTTEPVHPAAARRLLAPLSRANVVLVSDYGYGSVSDQVIAMLWDVRSVNARTRILVDAKRLDRYRTVHPDVVKPNYAQMCALLDEDACTDRREHVGRSATRLLDATGADAAVVTLDSQGAVVVEKGAIHFVDAPHVPVRSTSGAGDTLLASLTADMLEGAPLVEAVRHATWCASAACGSTGTVTVDHVGVLGKERNKRVRPDEIAAWGQRMRDAGRRIVLTNGCFDIFHAGHVHFLHEASLAGDVLLVAVNTDDRVRLLKGEARPVNTLEDRLRVLEAIDVVTAVTWFDEQTATEIARKLRPDVYVKGSDYRGEHFPEERFVRAHGGEVVFVDLLEGRSTSDIVDRVLRRGEVAV
jgi:D-beta-D-heptose 7-phosphate kinase/D-beta-D-heptose 1-phosphate adenosyltransferase